MIGPGPLTQLLEDQILREFQQAADGAGRLSACARGGRLLAFGPEVRRLTLGDASPDALWSHPEDLVVTADARMSLSTLNEALSKHRQWVPAEAADGHDDSLGGAVSAGVDTRFRGYGAFHERVLGMRVVTPGFGAIEVGARVVKNVAGYNLPRLFVGGRGSLGIISQVTLKVSPLPPLRRRWRNEGTLEEMALAAESCLHLAHPWAEIRLIQRDKGEPSQLWAEWHGISETIRKLERGLNMPSEIPDGTPVIGRVAGLSTLGGGVPRRMSLELIERWQGGPVTLEWQTGSFFGQLPIREAWEMMSWVRAHAGGVRILSGPVRDQPWPPALEEPWRRLKNAYDPDGVLF